MIDTKYVIPDYKGKEVTYTCSGTSIKQVFRNSSVYGEMYCILVNRIQIDGVIDITSNRSLVSDVRIYNDQFFPSLIEATNLLNRIYETYQEFDKLRKLNLEFYPDFEHDRFMVKRKYIKTDSMTLISYQINKMNRENFQIRDSILESMVEKETDA